MQIDYSHYIHYVWALLPEVVLAAGAVALLVYDGFTRERRTGSAAVGWGSLLVLGLAIASNLFLLRLHESGGTGMVAVDGFAVFVNFVFLGAAALVVLISFDYTRREGIGDGEFYALLLLAVVGMMLLAASRDLILIFLAFELMSIAAYALVGFNRRDAKSAEAALKYFLLGAFSSAFLLYGMAMLYGAAATTNLGLMHETLSAEGLGTPALFGIALLAVGFGFKVSAVPFHVWTPDAYEGAPTPVTAFLAAGIKGAAFAAFIRIFVVALGGLHAYWQGLIWWLALLTMILPNLIALVQQNIKRLLAYSSIAHAGYLLVALVSANESGMASFLFYVIAYTAMIVGAFAIVLLLAGKGDRLERVSDYAGIGYTRPWPAALLTVFLVSLAGLPPTGGFVGKVYILRAALEAGYVNLAIVLVVTTLISYYYYLRVIVAMYMRPGAEAGVPFSWGRPLRAAVALCAIAVLYLGLLPSWPLLKAQQTAAALREVAGQVVDHGDLVQH